MEVFPQTKHLFVIGANGVPRPRLVIISDDELIAWQRRCGPKRWAAYKGLVISMDLCQPCEQVQTVQPAEIALAESGAQCPAAAGPLDDACLGAIARHCLNVWLSLEAKVSSPANN